ncbi:MAG TPA: F0F1 ATP synthase subunit A [Bacteroidia bacterium]|jgi:F-type H+-transporting ATPase subunit a|nr:F0F1 ATP synthase subunit A [Bacteroidia bacterium]HRG52732.1 F0F1 ATP synthase subunit A [Bacteroidia bacterium]
MASKINIFKQFLLIIVLFFASAKANAQHEEEHNATITSSESHPSESHNEKFKAGETIIGHVADNHQWHLWGDLAIPLPAIVKTDKGVEVFSSAHFGHEGHATVYKGENYNYTLKEGSIVIVDDNNIENHEATATIFDLSITKNVVAMFVSMLLMVWMFLSVAKAYKNNKGKAPKGLQSFVEPLILFVRDDIAKPSIGKRYEQFLPFLLTVFFFIWINNLMGLIPFFPFGANVTGSISIAMTLAVFVFIYILFVGNKHYWRHILAMPGVPTWVLPILTIIELMGVVLRPFVLMIRLFANITAGHIIALAFFSLIFIFGEMSVGAGLGVSVLSLVFTVFMGALELLVAFLQAYVFTLLSAIYFGAAVDEGHDIHNHVDDHLPEAAHH